MEHPNEKARQRMKRYLRGSGLELGALHMPLDVKGSRVEQVRYVDRMSETDLRTHYPELASLPLVTVNIIDDAETLKTVPEASQDFIIANHLIEHTQDPIGSIMCWYSKLKKGGVLYMAVPDMKSTFDKDRPLTPLNHIIEDHECTPEQRKERNLEAFYEWSRLVNKTPEERVEAEVKHLVEMDYSIHYHTFTFQSMKMLLTEIQRRYCPGLILVAEEPTPASSYECIFVLAREQAPKLPSRWETLWGRITGSAVSSESAETIS